MFDHYNKDVTYYKHEIPVTLIWSFWPVTSAVVVVAAVGPLMPPGPSLPGAYLRGLGAAFDPSVLPLHSVCSEASHLLLISLPLLSSVPPEG